MIPLTPPSNRPNLADWWNGETYHHNSIPQACLAREVLQTYAFKGNEKVLDIGSGDGTVTSFIAFEKVPLGSVLGLDASRSMIETAVNNYSKANLSFQQGLAEAFQLNVLFDVIVSFTTLHWVQDQQAVWNNIRRHLNIGGRALVSLNPLPRSQALTEAINFAMKASQYSAFFQDFAEKCKMPFMTIGDYEKIILGTGLRVDECRQSMKFQEHENKTAFAANLKAWLPHVAQVPIELKEGFIQDIVEKFLEFSQQNGKEKVFLDYNNFLVKATRIN